MNASFKNWFKKRSLSIDERVSRFNAAASQLLRDNGAKIICDVKIEGPKDKEHFVQKKWMQLMEDYNIHVSGQIVVFPREALTDAKKSLDKNGDSDTMKEA